LCNIHAKQIRTRSPVKAIAPQELQSISGQASLVSTTSGIMPLNVADLPGRFNNQTYSLLKSCDPAMTERCRTLWSCGNDRRWGAASGVTKAVARKYVDHQRTQTAVAAGGIEIVSRPGSGVAFQVGKKTITEIAVDEAWRKAAYVFWLTVRSDGRRYSVEVP
jgi:hypothetical protein